MDKNRTSRILLVRTGMCIVMIGKKTAEFDQLRLETPCVNYYQNVWAPSRLTNYELISMLRSSAAEDVMELNFFDLMTLNEHGGNHLDPFLAILCEFRILHFTRDDKIAIGFWFSCNWYSSVQKIIFLSFARSIWLFHNGAKLKKENHPAWFTIWFCYYAVNRLVERALLMEYVRVWVLISNFFRATNSWHQAQHTTRVTMLIFRGETKQPNTQKRGEGQKKKSPLGDSKTIENLLNVISYKEKE